MGPEVGDGDVGEMLSAVAVVGLVTGGRLCDCGRVVVGKGLWCGGWWWW